MGVFVESAIPTALILAVNAITLEKDLPRQGREMIHGKDRDAFEQQHGQRLSELMSGTLPGNALYIHPVKLSRWQLGL